MIGTDGRFNFSPTNDGGLDLSSSPLMLLHYVQGKWQIAQ